MSYDFAIWESDASTGETDAAATFEELFTRYLEGDLVAPTTKIQAYSEALAARFPDDESEDSPWAAGSPSSNCSGPILYVAVRYNHAHEVGVVAERLAQEHNLVFFDPQKPPTAPVSGGEVTITTSQGTAALPDRWVSFLSHELRNFDSYVVVDSGRDHVFAQARNDNGNSYSSTATAHRSSTTRFRASISAMSQKRCPSGPRTAATSSATTPGSA